ncbi:unnamed protein product [Symbiodinium natans]|uniref:AP2/ERF domain-containing protein n=1 Tax=Symbiodinium natans TaxID=878477 RepID=A0A812N419_9DINO|nr:unnamed protein product [Symbiodinium natans]
MIRRIAPWALGQLLGQPNKQQAGSRSCWSRCVSSQYNGVSWSKGRGKFEAKVYFKRRQEYVGLFLTEKEAAHAHDVRLRALCDDGARLKRSLNFATPLEESFSESPQESRRRALAFFSETARNEEKSFDRFKRLFSLSHQARNYEVIRTSGSSKVDAIFQLRGSLTGGLALQLKSASLIRERFLFRGTRGYAGMLLLLIALDSDACWALPGASVTQINFSVTPGSSRDMAFRVEDIGSLLESCFRNTTDFPHVSLADARFQCSPKHQVEERAHSLFRTLFHCVGFQLEKSFTGLATVDSDLMGDRCRWRVQEKASNVHACGRYCASLCKNGGALGKLAYSETDFDLLLAALLEDGRLSGLFAFPTDVLARLGYIGQKPCHLPLYPPWRLPKWQHTRAKHAWQLEHFVDLRSWDAGTPLSPEMRDTLEDLLLRLAACQQTTCQSDR